MHVYEGTQALNFTKLRLLNTCRNLWYLRRWRLQRRSLRAERPRKKKRTKRRTSAWRAAASASTASRRCERTYGCRTHQNLQSLRVVLRARSVASAAIHAASERSSIGLRAHILLFAWLGWLLSGKPNDGTRSRLPKRHALLSAQDCGNCYNCQDKPKFGGPGARSTLAQPPPLCRALRPAACHQMGGSPCVPASSRGTPCPRHCRG